MTQVSKTISSQPTSSRSLPEVAPEKRGASNAKKSASKAIEGFQSGGFFKEVAKSLLPTNSRTPNASNQNPLQTAAKNYQKDLKNRDFSKILGRVGSEVQIGTTALAVKQGLTTAFKAMRPKAFSLGKQMMNQIPNPLANRNITESAINLTAHKALPSIMPLTLPTASNNITQFGRHPSPASSTNLEHSLALATARPVTHLSTVATAPSQRPTATYSTGGASGTGPVRPPNNSTTSPARDTPGGNSGGAGHLGGSGGSPPGQGPVSSSSGGEKPDWEQVLNNSRISPFRQDTKYMNLSGQNLSKWDFSERKISNANLTDTYAPKLNMSGAVARELKASGADLTGANMSRATLDNARLEGIVAPVSNWSGARAREANLSGADLTKANLTNANLSSSILEKAQLQRAELVGSDLRNANMRGANLEDAFVQDAKFGNADFRGANAKKIRFGLDAGTDLTTARNYGLDPNMQVGGTKEAVQKLVEDGVPMDRMMIVYGADLRGAKLNSINAPDAKIDGVNLAQSQLQNANLPGASIRSTDLDHANLFQANLNSANLSGSKIRSSNLSRVNLKRANLKNVDFSNSVMTHAQLSGADLNNARLRSVDLKGADLSKTGLYDADLSRANLRGANLSEASLMGANLVGTKLENTRFLRNRINSKTNLGLKNVFNWDLYSSSLWYESKTPNLPGYLWHVVSRLPKSLANSTGWGVKTAFSRLNGFRLP
jgi:uncharacterized protein YjbI with pentapeptide repeats